MNLIKAFAAGAILAAGAALAETAPTDPNAIARSNLMKSVVINIGILGNMASGKEPYDAAKAEGAKAKLVDAAAKIEATYKEQGAADPASEAKPEIWTNWEDFLVKAKAFGDASGAVDVASAETIGAGLGAVGGTCKDCHTTYRVAN